MNPDRPSTPGRLSRWHCRRVTRGIAALQDASDRHRADIVAGVMRDHHVALLIVTIVMFFALAFGSVWIGVRASHAINGWAQRAAGMGPGAWSWTVWPELIEFACMLAAFGAVLALWGWVHIHTVRGFVARRFRLTQSVCVRCGYDLTSLREQGPVVTCPECAMANRFEGWTSGYAELIQRRGGTHAGPGPVASTPTPPDPGVPESRA